MKGKPKIQGKYEEGKNTASEVKMRLKDWTLPKNKQWKDKPNQTAPQKLNQVKGTQTRLHSTSWQEEKILRKGQELSSRVAAVP